MENNKGQVFNGRTVAIGLSTAGIGSFLTVITFIVNAWVAPLEKNLQRQDVALSELRAEIKRIADLAAERGVAIPRIREDTLRIEGELARIRERLDRFEQGQRIIAPPTIPR